MKQGSFHTNTLHPAIVETRLTLGLGCGSLRSISHTLIQVLEGLSQSRPGVDEKQHPLPNGLGDSSACPALGDSPGVKTAVAVLCAVLLTPRPPGDLDAAGAGLHVSQPMTAPDNSRLSPLADIQAGRERLTVGITQSHRTGMLTQ